MKLSLIFAAVLLLFQGCASTLNPATQLTSEHAAEPAQPPCGESSAPECANSFASVNTISPVILRAASPTAIAATTTLPHGAEIERNDNTPVLEGRPLTSVVVTQCNLVVAVYMTMPDGRLLRFDQRAEVPAQELVTIAYTAARSERVEVACEGLGAAGYETHDSV